MTSIVLAATLAASVAGASLGSKPPVTRQAEGQEKVWINEDLEALHARGLISIIGVERVEPPAGEEALAEPALRPPKELGPDWYREQAEAIRAALLPIEEEIRSLRRNLTCSCTPQGGIRLDQGNAGITPESGIWVLEGRARELHGQLEALEDQARRNDLPPGTFR